MTTNTAMPIPAILAPSPAPAARQNDAPVPEKPFNQVLSKEVADRQQKNAVKNDAPAPAKQSEPANRSAPSDADVAAKSTATNAAKADKTAKEDKPEEKQHTEDGTTGTIPAALLEMVASLAHRSAQAATPAADAQSANTSDTARLADGLHSTKGAKANGRQAPETGSDPAAAVDARANEKGEAPHSAKADAALRKAVLSATDSQPAHQSAKAAKAAEAAAQPIGVPNLPSTAAPLAANALEHLQPAGNRLTPPVGTSAWGQALGQKVVWMVAGAEQSASLSLNPPDLGPLQVVLNVSHAQADATFISAQPEVRQALEAALPKLRDMLGEAGIQLGQASVNAGTPQQQGEFGRPSHSSSRSSAAGDDTAPAPIAAASRTASRIGMVDTFA